MCRFTFYYGPPLPIASLVTEPENSLINQSHNAREREEPLNGDGFGVVWYPGGELVEPGRFRALTPAWNNANLLSLARVVKSSCVLAHVRAATQVRAISEANCHPFVVGRHAFMHNGDLGGFDALRRRLVEQLSDRAFAAIEGQTDSEHLFALFLDELERVGDRGDTIEGLRDAVFATIARALELSARHAPGHDSYLNIAVTDGVRAVVTRFTTDTSYDGETLYWNSGKRYVCEGGACRMVEADPAGRAIIVSSERLSTDPGWEAVPRNSALLVDADRRARVVPIDLAGVRAAA
jgi:predicted glutamine amidotransferase